MNMSGWKKKSKIPNAFKVAMIELSWSFVQQSVQISSSFTESNFHKPILFQPTPAQVEQLVVAFHTAIMHSFRLERISSGENAH